MTDYAAPSMFFANFLILLLVVGAAFFFVRSLKDGYLGSSSEEPKYRMLEDDSQTIGADAPRRS